MNIEQSRAFINRFRPRSRIAWAALIGLAGYISSDLLGAGVFRFVFGLVAALAFVVLGFRLLGYARTMLLWRLRNRLLVTYLFISIIPIGLIVLMVGLTSYLLYGQLAAYLITSDLESKALRLGAVNQSLAAGLGAVAGNDLGSREVAQLMRRERQALAEEFGEVQVQFVAGRSSVALSPGSPDIPCGQAPAWVEGAFHGVISAGGQLYLHSMTRLPGGRPERSCLTAKVDAQLLNQVGGEVGPYSMILLEEESQSAGGVQFSLEDKNFTVGQTLEPDTSTLPEPGYFFDPSIFFAASFQVVLWDIQKSDRVMVPILLSLTTRASLLNQRIFAPLGERGFSQVFLLLLTVVGVILLLVQLVAVITGVRLTRSITYAVHELYAATLGVQAGDFSVRIKTKRDDQLGTLCDSFNQMASSIEGLIEESKARQRLENEVEIARQVQEQLFPQEVPLLNTLQMAGRCVPASGVSGDYYDFGVSAPGKLVLTIGDISGKGISAALLMASIQSSLRGQVYASQLAGQLDQLSVADLVGRVNRQLCANSSPEKYSTLFVAFYDDQTRELTYTNAGHLPPMLVRNGSLEALTTGGAVVGLFRDIEYEQETVTLQPKDCLVAYTDGVTEMENSYEEDYGIPRLQDFLRRSSAGLNPDRLIDVLFDELEVWAPGTEASDDRTLLVARAL